MNNSCKWLLAAACLAAPAFGLAASMTVTSGLSQDSSANARAQGTENISSLKGKTPDSEGLDQDARTDEFIRLTQRAQAVQEADLRRTLGESDLAGMQALVKAVSMQLPQPEFVKNPNKLATIQQLFVRDVALRLSSLGFSVADVRARNRGGADLVAAAAEAVRGSATVAQLTLLSDKAFTGRVVAFDTRDTRPDGFHSSVKIQVIQATKGVAVGDTITIRQASGEFDGKILRRSSDFLGEVGDEVVVIASSALYSGGKSSNASVALPLVPIAFARRGIDTADQG